MNHSVLEAKKALVNEISAKFTESISTVVVEYRGLSVAQMTTLRRQLKDEGIELKIYKNKMASRAAEAAGYNDLSADLTGPNALAFGKDAVAPSRILAQFAKKNKALVLKSGIVEGKVVDADMIKELSTLPNRDGMISMILGLFQAPIRNFAYAVSQVAETRNEEAPVVEAKEEVAAKEAPAAETASEAEVVEAKEEVAAKEAPAAETASEAEVVEAKEEVTKEEETKTEDQ